MVALTRGETVGSEEIITTMIFSKRRSNVFVMGQGFSDLVIVVVKPDADDGVETHPRRKHLENSRKAEDEGRDTLTRLSLNFRLWSWSFGKKKTFTGGMNRKSRRR